MRSQIRVSSLNFGPTKGYRRWDRCGTPEDLILAALAAVFLAYVMAEKSPNSRPRSFILPIAGYIIVRPLGGLLLDPFLILQAPYWLTLGTAQASVLTGLVVAALQAPEDSSDLA